MSILETACNADGCIQCWAAGVVEASPAAVEAVVEAELAEDPRMLLVGLPEPAVLATLARSGRREIRLIARLTLLEPHECGKEPGDDRQGLG